MFFSIHKQVPPIHRSQQKLVNFVPHAINSCPQTENRLVHTSHPDTRPQHHQLATDRSTPSGLRAAQRFFRKMSFEGFETRQAVKNRSSTEANWIMDRRHSGRRVRLRWSRMSSTTDAFVSAEDWVYSGVDRPTVGIMGVTGLIRQGRGSAGGGGFYETVCLADRIEARVCRV